MALVELGLPTTTSHSQRKSYNTCPEQFRLERKFKIPQPPAWWFLGGSAVHASTESWDRHDLDPALPLLSFDEALDLEIEKALKAQPTYTKDDWRASKGKATVAYGKREGEQWWRDLGPRVVENWVQFRRLWPWDIVMLNGDKPAIEVDITYRLGDNEIRLFIDRVFQSRADPNVVSVLDLKSGPNKEDTYDQLGLYARAFEWEFNLSPFDVQWGAFWYGREGTSGLHDMHDLDGYTPERLQYEFDQFKYKRDHEFFAPNPGKHCGWCSARPYCIYQNGEFSDQVRPPWVDPDEWALRVEAADAGVRADGP